MNINRNQNILKWFKRLEEWDIPYYLLRPLDLKKDEKDVDIIVSKANVQRLAQRLKELNFHAEVTTSVAEYSVGIIVDNDLLLDIKTRICFLPSKFYSFKNPPPYSGIKIESDGIIYPEVSPEKLFTFWILHFFLDKKHPSLSGSYDIFCQKYAKNALQMLQSEFCQIWLHRVFKRKKDDAEYVLHQFCENNFQTTTELARYTKELILRRNLSTFITFYLEKIKYAIIRRTKKEFYKPITAYHG